MSWFERKAKQIREKLKSQYVPPSDNLETAQEYKERWKSIYIIYFTMFLISLGFSIIVTGVWPYLDKLDPTAGKQFMGFVVAANPFGQMIFSPLLGWWSNRLGSVKPPIVITLIIFTISSGLYSSVELIEENRKYWMLIARFFVGVSSANVAVCRSYLSAATRYSERTQAVAMISLAQVLGFVVGPAIQAAVVPLGTDGVWLISNRLKLDMYTASGWINVLMALFNIYLFMPSVFKEHKIAGREAMLLQGKDNIKDTYKEQKTHYFSTWSLIVAFFVIVFNFMLLETLATPLTMDQFAWSKPDSLKYMGMLMAIGAVIAIMTSVAIPYLSKRYSEVKIMVWGGFFFMVLGRAIYIPFGSDPPPMYDSELKLNLTFFCDRTINRPTFSAQNLSLSDLEILNQQVGWKFNGTFDTKIDLMTLNKSIIENLTFSCGEDLLGCPSTQEWCKYVPALTVTNFIIGYLLTTFGYPLGVTLIQTVFSKILGTRPQGLWMGLLTGSGCLSRVMGPVFVTHIYENFGTVWTFGFTTAMMFGCLLWLIFFEKYITPKGLILTSTNQEDERGQELQSVVLLDNKKQTPNNSTE